MAVETAPTKQCEVRLFEWSDFFIKTTAELDTEYWVLQELRYSYFSLQQPIGQSTITHGYCIQEMHKMPTRGCYRSCSPDESTSYPTQPRKPSLSVLNPESVGNT